MLHWGLTKIHSCGSYLFFSNRVCPSRSVCSNLTLCTLQKHFHVSIPGINTGNGDVKVRIFRVQLCSRLLQLVLADTTQGRW
jgi:hypothetical protein